MSCSPLLTIIVPTYNRADRLSLLLKSIFVDSVLIRDNIEIIIGDNASSDNTEEVLNDFRLLYSKVIIFRNSENVGPDENFCRCLELVKSKYFWIIGDDDLPKKGVIQQIVEILKNNEVDIFYINSEWLPSIKSSTDGEKIHKLNYRKVARDEFAAKVNVWMTYISSIIINKERLIGLYPDIDIRRFHGTSLVQLGWVLPMLLAGSNFIICTEKCLLATANNSGGYGLFKVFGSNLPFIVDVMCGSASKISIIMRRELQWRFIPRLIMGSRFGLRVGFQLEDISSHLTAFKGGITYFLTLWPLIYLPKLVAYIYYSILMFPMLCGRLSSKISRLVGLSSN